MYVIKDLVPVSVCMCYGVSGDGVRSDSVSSDVWSDNVRSDDVRSDSVRSDGVRSDSVRSDGVSGDSVRSNGVRSDGIGISGDSVSSDGVSGDSVSETWLLFSLQDLSNLYDQYRSIQPWLQRKEETQSDKELYQSVEDRKKLVSDTLHLLHTHFTYPHPLSSLPPLSPSPSRTQSGWSL